MITRPVQPRRITRSEMLYRALLWLYPPTFRRMYGREMLQTFRDCYRDTVQQEGVAGLVRLWRLVLPDFVVSVCSEQVRAGISLFRRLSGLEEKEYQLMSLLTLDTAARTDIGLKRANNEDNVVTVVPTDTHVMAQKGALFVVADGMGGHTKGEVASALAVNTIRDTYYQDARNDIAAALRASVEQANKAIFEHDMHMGTTCVAAVLKDNTVYIANAGDSFVYLIRGGQMRQLAEDHSWVAEQVRTGAMTREEAEAQGKGNVIVRCLGETRDVEVYIGTEQVQDKDILVLCTDGLHGLVNEDEIRAIVEQYEPEESVQRLIARANENGGTDNITAAVIRVSLAQ